MVTLFTYGSLMSEDIMRHVAGTHCSSARATLEDHCRSRILAEEYPAVVPHKGSRVPGTAYFDIDEKALRRLDMFEGEMYARKKVEVTLHSGESVEAMAYIFKPEFLHLLTWEQWDYEEFLKKGKNNFITKYFGFKEIG